jgi:hypothetical protein
MRFRSALTSFLLIPVLCALPLWARVVRVEIASRTPVLGGKAFGTAGAYERITGRIYFSLPVANPRNLRIVDLRNAVNLKDGQVEFSSDFIALRPAEARKGNGSMLLEIPNRGRGHIVALVDGGDWDLASDAGDAWLLRNGYTIVSRQGRVAPSRPGRQRRREDHHRTAARRSNALEGAAGNSAGALDGGPHRRNRIPGGRARRPTQHAHG